MLVTLVVTACGLDDPSRSPLPARSAPPDTSALTDEIRNRGGPVVLELTGWTTPRVIEEIVDAGLEPLPGYERVERLDSMGLNLVGGTVPPGRLDAVLAIPYIVNVRPADVVGQRR